MSGYIIDEIIIRIARENKNLSINEIKKMVKNEVKLKVDEKIASKISIDYIIDVMIKNKGIIFNEDEKKNKSNYQDEKEINKWIIKI